MSEEEKQPGPARTPSRLEKEENWLWRTALLFLVLMATALAAESWERLQNLPYHLGLLSVGVLCVAIAFAGFAYGRRKRVTELKALVRDLQERVSTPSEQQLDQLGQLIARSQRSFKELIDSIDDVAFAVSLDGKLRTVNRRMAELLGIPYTEVVGHKLEEFLDEPKREVLERELGRFLETKRWSGAVEVRLKSSRRTLYFDCVVNAIVKGGEVVGVSTLARDVTEEHEKERRFTALFETLQEGIYFSTPEGKLLDGNTALVRVLGYESKAELVALDPKALNSEPNQNPVLGRSADDQGGVRTREITLRRKDGRPGTFLDTSRAVWDASGKIVRYQGTLVDVTERREMERALRRQEKFQRDLLESFPDLILVIDLDERYSFVSSRVYDLLGFTPEELLKKKIEAGQDYSADLLVLVRNLIAGRQQFGTCECGARHYDGSWRTMRASASQLFDAESKVSGVIVSVRDITMEKKLEQQIIQSERLAAMGQMIGGFAHELNNPLTGILGMSELLQDSQGAETSRKQLQMLQQQARRAVEIVQNLMYFARPPAPGKGPIDLGELVQRTLHLHAYSLRKSNITVDFLHEASIPPITGDAHQLMQVFLNLILNSEQAMREVRDRGTLRIRMEKHDHSVAVIFQDDGPGIPPDILPNIFDPFYTTKRPGRGTGLGLSICKAILREHSGNVEATSGPGGGAVFTVMLPVSDKTAVVGS
ncbi:MAG TPA: PAS domain S-box protein [Terriglobales bacterium]|jgi:PAS domain S-box-containing protein|nr:PAS domain S-box protein [Terriglobales bacterium]